MKDYVFTHLEQEIRIDSIVTVHYFEYNSDFFFPGEVHNFWELLYVDKGEVEVTAGETRLLLKKGDIIFHKPMEFHNLKANGVNGPNLVVVAFDCHSPAMRFFDNRIMTADNDVCNLLGTIVDEAGAAFMNDLGDPDMRQLELLESGVPFGALQMIRVSLELLLLHLVRESDALPAKPHTSSAIHERTGDDVFSRVVLYLEQNVHERITLDDVCRDNLFGRSYLQKVFREKSGGGVMEYFGKMKVETAKREIREGANNFTEIANHLGYASIHYFSRHFKKITGMTPTEYASSVKIRSEKQKGRPVFFYE